MTWYERNEMSSVCILKVVKSHSDLSVMAA